MFIKASNGLDRFSTESTVQSYNTRHGEEHIRECLRKQYPDASEEEIEIMSKINIGKSYKEPIELH